MIDLGNGEYLDDAGELFITVQEDPDPFASPGTLGKLTRKRTGMFYLDVPTYGLLGVWWKNNPLQFATASTAEQMAVLASRVASVASVECFVEEVRVGPFSWRDKHMLRVLGKNGKRAVLCAGMEAAEFARDRSPESYMQRLADRIAGEFAGDSGEADV